MQIKELIIIQKIDIYVQNAVNTMKKNDNTSHSNQYLKEFGCFVGLGFQWSDFV